MSTIHVHDPRPFPRVLALAALTATLALGGCSLLGHDDNTSAQPSSPAAKTKDESGRATASARGQTVQVVGSTAKDNGVSGNGGTLVGAQEQEQPPQWVQLAAVKGPHVPGVYVANIDEATLYRFDKDSNDPPTSNCYGDCAEKWPPVTIQKGGAVYLGGVNPKLVGAMQRKDGEIQLTVGGWPIYRFSGDDAQGDANGQGVDGTWFAVSPGGQPVT